MKKIKFDAERAQEIQKALENMKNDTLKAMAADMIHGALWSKSQFSKDDPQVQEPSAS